MPNNSTLPISELARQVSRALDVSVPIICVHTGDAGATQQSLMPHIGQRIHEDGPRPVVAWDLFRGIYPLNPAGKELLANVGDQDVEATKNNPMKLVSLSLEFPDETVIFCHNPHLSFEDEKAFIQGVWNVRDEFKQNGRCLILLEPIGVTLPMEIRSDVMLFDDPLPDDDELNAIVGQQITNFETVEERELTEVRQQAGEAAAALKGTIAFQAEQIAAMSIEATGFAHKYLNNQARKLIEQTKGLMFERGTETFADVCGLDGVEEWARDVFNGPAAPRVIVRIEEIEKAMAGVGTDLSGTSSDTLQVLLSNMEDEGWDGALCYGVPGSGKSLMAKSMANTYNVRGLVLDINACRESLLGHSEQNIRKAIEIIKTIGGDRVMFLASCNQLDRLPPELGRRFRSGVWFFNTPAADAREEMWHLHADKYNLDESFANLAEIDEEYYTGADIRDICEQAYKRSRSITDAKRWVVPLNKRSPDAIKNARAKADGKYWDVSTGLVYQRDDADKPKQKPGGRKTRLAKGTA